MYSQCTAVDIPSLTIVSFLKAHHALFRGQALASSNCPKRPQLICDRIQGFTESHPGSSTRLSSSDEISCLARMQHMYATSSSSSNTLDVVLRYKICRVSSLLGKCYSATSNKEIRHIATSCSTFGNLRRKSAQRAPWTGSESIHRQSSHISDFCAWGSCQCLLYLPAFIFVRVVISQFVEDDIGMDSQLMSWC